MTLISTLTSSSSSMSSLTSTTSSAMMLSVILTCCAIAIGVLIFLLVLKDVTSKSDSWNEHKAATLRVMYVPLIVTFSAFLVFTVAQFV